MWVWFRVIKWPGLWCTFTQSRYIPVVLFEEGPWPIECFILFVSVDACLAFEHKFVIFHLDICYPCCMSSCDCSYCIRVNFPIVSRFLETLSYWQFFFNFWCIACGLVIVHHWLLTISLSIQTNDWTEIIFNSSQIITCDLHIFSFIS